MVAFAILGVVCIYVGLWYYIVQALPGFWIKLAAVFVAVLLPVWDAPIGYFKFATACAEGAGLRIFHPMPPQKSVFVDAKSQGSIDWLLKNGLQYVELGQLGQHLQVITSSNRKPAAVDAPATSLFGYRSHHRVGKGAARVDRFDSEIFSLKSGEVVARYSEFRWFLWLQDFVVPLLGRGWRCPKENEEDAIVKLVVRGASR